MAPRLVRFWLDVSMVIVEAEAQGEVQAEGCESLAVEEGEEKRDSWSHVSGLHSQTHIKPNHSLNHTLMEFI